MTSKVRLPSLSPAPPSRAEKAVVDLKRTAQFVASLQRDYTEARAVLGATTRARKWYQWVERRVGEHNETYGNVETLSADQFATVGCYQTAHVPSEVPDSFRVTDTCENGASFDLEITTDVLNITLTIDVKPKHMIVRFMTWTTDAVYAEASWDRSDGPDGIFAWSDVKPDDYLRVDVCKDGAIVPRANTGPLCAAALEDLALIRHVFDGVGAEFPEAALGDRLRNNK